mmetsp:Transcript_114405/g.363607  ORF Transcript_114405/g.363607 Transcript_114405/m.363607 type:complete len:319 (+) Transcript_114405:2176-3132(+)
MAQHQFLACGASIETICRTIRSIFKGQATQEAIHHRAIRIDRVAGGDHADIPRGRAVQVRRLGEVLSGDLNDLEVRIPLTYEIPVAVVDLIEEHFATGPMEWRPRPIQVLVVDLWCPRRDLLDSVGLGEEHVPQVEYQQAHGVESTCQMCHSSEGHSGSSERLPHVTHDLALRLCPGLVRMACQRFCRWAAVHGQGIPSNVVVLQRLDQHVGVLAAVVLSITGVQKPRNAGPLHDQDSADLLKVHGTRQPDNRKRLSKHHHHSRSTALQDLQDVVQLVQVVELLEKIHSVAAGFHPRFEFLRLVAELHGVVDDANMLP